MCLIAKLDFWASRISHLSILFVEILTRQFCLVFGNVTAMVLITLIKRRRYSISGYNSIYTQL